MGTPTQKRTKSSKGQRGSHSALKKPSVTKCANCGASILPHNACRKCGYFKGVKKISVRGKVNKK